MNTKKMKISLILNIIIFLMVLVASIIMFSGIPLMEGEKVLEESKLAMFKFFTVDSNIFMGLVALYFIIKEYNILKGKETTIGVKAYIFKLMSTVGVTVTFLTVFLYLGPISKGGIPSMLMNSNLFYHLLIPVFSLIAFIFFENNDKLAFKHSFYGILPTTIYGVFYLINILIHMEEGKVSPLYDWYWFVQGGLWQVVIVLPIMFLISYLLSFALWKLNKKEY